MPKRVVFYGVQNFKSDKEFLDILLDIPHGIYVSTKRNCYNYLEVLSTAIGHLQYIERDSRFPERSDKIKYTCYVYNDYDILKSNNININVCNIEMQYYIHLSI